MTTEQIVIIKDHEQTISALLMSSKEALVAICKGSRLCTYTKRLVIINNLMRAFIVNYDLPEDVDFWQKRLKHTLTRAERNKKVFTTRDKLFVAYALEQYEFLVRSATEEQLHEMFVYIDKHALDAKTAIVQSEYGGKVITRR